MVRPIVVLTRRCGGAGLVGNERGREFKDFGSSPDTPERTRTFV